MLSAVRPRRWPLCWLELAELAELGDDGNARCVPGHQG